MTISSCCPDRNPDTWFTAGYDKACAGRELLDWGRFCFTGGQLWRLHNEEKHWDTHTHKHTPSPPGMLVLGFKQVTQNLHV